MKGRTSSVISLASYKLPKRVEFSETDLPKNGSGKARAFLDASATRRKLTQNRLHI
jgi:hypothetical protein